MSNTHLVKTLARCKKCFCYAKFHFFLYWECVKDGRDERQWKNGLYHATTSADGRTIALLSEREKTARQQNTARRRSAGERNKSAGHQAGEDSAAPSPSLLIGSLRSFSVPSPFSLVAAFAAKILSFVCSSAFLLFFYLVAANLSSLSFACSSASRPF